MGDVTYLMYHEIAAPGRELCNEDPGYVRYVVGVDDFRAQLAALRRAGVAGLSVGEALAARGGGECAAITFDDGCETDLVTAAPLLEDAGFNATFYVTVEHLGRRGYLSRPQLKELAERGFEIGSHAMTHRYLHDLSDSEVRSELADSKRELEDLTGKPVEHFSCPGGRWDRRVSEEARRAGYASLVTSVIGQNSDGTDRFKLTRIAVMRGMPASEVGRIVRGKGIRRRQAKGAALDAAKHLLGNGLYEKVRGAALTAKTMLRAAR